MEERWVLEMDKRLGISITPGWLHDLINDEKSAIYWASEFGKRWRTLFP